MPKRARAPPYYEMLFVLYINVAEHSCAAFFMRNI